MYMHVYIAIHIIFFFICRYSICHPHFCVFCCVVTVNLFPLKVIWLCKHTYCKLCICTINVVIIQPPQNQSVCEGGTVNFTCVVMFTSGSPGAATWFTNNGANDASREPDHTVTDNSNGRSAPANVTTVLTVTNVSNSDNGEDYICAQGLSERSDIVFLTVLGT